MKGHNVASWSASATRPANSLQYWTTGLLQLNTPSTYSLQYWTTGLLQLHKPSTSSAARLDSREKPGLCAGSLPPSSESVEESFPPLRTSPSPTAGGPESAGTNKHTNALPIGTVGKQQIIYFAT